MEDRNQEHLNSEVEIALLKQRVDMMERDVRVLDNDIKSLRAEIKQSFEKVFERFDAMRDELQGAKSFGQGVYWVLGSLVAIAITFKDQLIALLGR